MDRLDINSMYSTSHKSSQAGGSNSPNSPNSPNSVKRKGKTYNPADIDGESASALDKFRKANRLLQKELNEVKEELKIEKQKTSTLDKQLKASNF